MTKLIIFQHVDYEGPGLILDWAQQNNVELEIIKVWRSQKTTAGRKY